MRTYKLSNGYTVTANRLGWGTEFETSNPEGEVISNVFLTGMDAAEVERDLIIVNLLAAR